MLPLLLIALQAVPAAPSEGKERVSILPPDCPTSADARQDILVCGRRPGSDRAPELRGGPSDHAIPSNPEMTAIEALRAEGTPCAASQRGCAAPVDVVTPALMLANEAGIGISTLFDKRRDKSRRVPIALDGPGPQGHLEP
ncbi:hypothetical protein [Sphingomonas yabuuchiae]|uniref:Uncharacterized protein n=1 Tax=Sphingomonas yabuuchiae TaxID=172044 RepID=A0AA40ZZK4_9SPHN|nr:hypothetical protein [Sphingomonas yabuuchiae]MBB4609064.1 hypothetical protein [Sphingomonas yabuuchiae]MBN3559310.1 hypothetical protein [Sphingomonas yabuuchiae]